MTIRLILVTVLAAESFQLALSIFPACQPNTTIALFNTTYTGVVRQDVQIIFVFELEPNEIISDVNTILRVGTNSSTGSTLENSLSVTVLQPLSSRSSSFLLPTFRYQNGSISSGNEDNYNAKRTLCILNNKTTENITLSVMLSTGSENSIPFSINITNGNDFLLELKTTKRVSVSPNTPTYFGFKFPIHPELKFVRVLIDANLNYSDKGCMTISIQTLTCPVYDKEKTIEDQGMFQTIRNKGAFVVMNEAPFKDGFIVVVLAHRDPDVCERKTHESSPILKKSFSDETSFYPYAAITLDLTVVDDDTQDLSTIFIILSWIAPYLLALVAVLESCVVLWWRQRWIGYGNGHVINENVYLNSTTASNDQAKNDQTDTVTDTPSIWKRVWSTGKCLWCEVGSFYRLLKEEDIFKYFTLIVAIFLYPTYKTADLYIKASSVSGDSDLCLFNYRCIQPLFGFDNFNHFVSNGVYLILGFTFIVQAMIHELFCKTFTMKYVSKHSINEQIQNSDDVELSLESEHEANDYQTAPNAAMFQVLGMVVILEGYLSGLFHICPRESTFELGISLIYIIWLLIIVHMYQLRHPVFPVWKFLSNFAHIVAITFVAFIYLPSINKVVKGSMLCAIQIMVVLLFSFNYYFTGNIRNADGCVVNDHTLFWHIFKRETYTSGKFKWTRLLYCVVSIGINLTCIVLWSMFECYFSTYLFYMIVVNALWNVSNYVIMKLVHGEFTRTSWILPIVYFCTAGMLAIYAFKFYTDAASKWEVSPAKAHEFNHNCLNMFGIAAYPYDSHDAWHFLSATVLFYFLNGLLILDDDLISAQLKSIPMF